MELRLIEITCERPLSLGISVPVHHTHEAYRKGILAVGCEEVHFISDRPKHKPKRITKCSPI